MEFLYCRILVVCVVVVSVLQQCTVTKKSMYPEMYEKPPLSILVLPPQNESTAADAQEFYQTTISEPLSCTGYYVYPIEVIVDILKKEGLYENVDFRNIDPSRFKKIFGADAVMYINILKWDKVYYVIGGNVKVSVDMKLVSTETGEVLWNYNGTLVVDTSSSSGGGGIGGIIAGVIATAIKTGVTDYVPIARKANIKALKAMPYGKYHPKHLKDGKQRAVNREVLNKVEKREQQ